MNYSEFHEYKNIIDKLQNSPNFKKYLELYNISEDKPITYAAFFAMKGIQKIKSQMRNLTKKERETNSNSDKTFNASSYCTNITSILSNHIFNDIQFFDNVLNEYNSQFSEFNKYCRNCDNPYILNSEQLNSHLFDKQSEDKKENIEYYLQVMTLSNKASKILSLFNNYNTDQTVAYADKMNQRNKASGRNNVFSTSKRDYLKLFEEISRLSNEQTDSGSSLKLDFLNTYNKYIRKEISLDELKKSQAYINVNNLFRSKNTKNCYITPEAIYNNLLLNYSINNLYLQKSHFFKKSFKEFAKLSQTKKAYKYRLTKHVDSQNPKLSGSSFNTTVNIAISGYNAPFSIHENLDTLSELENKFGITIEEGNIPRPYVTPIPYKYTSSQRRAISDINSIVYKRGANPKAISISNFSNNMLFSVNTLEKNNETSKVHDSKVSRKIGTLDTYEYR